MAAAECSTSKSQFIRQHNIDILPRQKISLAAHARIRNIRNPDTGM